MFTAMIVIATQRIVFDHWMVGIHHPSIPSALVSEPIAIAMDNTNIKTYAKKSSFF